MLCVEGTFDTQYFYHNKNRLSINDYNPILHNNPTCKNNHILTFVNGNNNKTHFRHKNSENEGPWHKMIKYLFDKKYHEKYIGKHCADLYFVDATEPHILEIQHNINITVEDIKSREENANNNNIILNWIIDGSGCKTYSVENRVIIKINPPAYIILQRMIPENKIIDKNILLDINGKIYKINLKDIGVDWLVSADTFITYKMLCNIIANNTFLSFMKNNYIIAHSKSIVKQMGAGNGKTFNAVQMLMTESCQYTQICFFVKQHAARTVLLEEMLKTERKKNTDKLLFDYLLPIDNSVNNIDKYVDTETFKNKSLLKFIHPIHNHKVTITISTIDSFTCSLGNSNINGPDKFRAYARSITKGFRSDNFVNNEILENSISFCTGKSRFMKDRNGNGISITKNTLLVVDEVQDLHKDYAEALTYISKYSHCDLYLIGDRLQCIMENNNAFDFFMSNPNIPNMNCIIPDATNYTIRFNHPKLINFVNTVIPFEKFNLPKVEPHPDFPYKKKSKEGDILKFLSEGKETEDTADIIMEYYKTVVELHNYKPNDIAIIHPAPNNMGKEIFNLLQKSIVGFWFSEKDCDYSKPSVYHRSEDRGTIKLSESIMSTRQYSIHASKGDGRKCVIVMGLTEQLLRYMSDGTNTSLQFWSFVHVALTRMKERIAIVVGKQNDCITERYQEIDEYKKELASNKFIHKLDDNMLSINRLTNIVYNDNTELFDK